jgi:uncharacterized protein with GYD domain
MPTYISLVQFTDNGIRAAKDTTHRVADWAGKVKSRGVSIKQIGVRLRRPRRRDSRRRVTRGGYAG